MECFELSPKRRKMQPSDCQKSLFVNDCAVSQNLNGGVCVAPKMANTNAIDWSMSGVFLSHFIDRLRLRTIPHITPLLERLTEAENKNITALKSIDKINKRIKELEFHVEKKIKPVSTSSVAIGADITDPNSEEYKRITNGLQSSPFAPFKPPTSPACKPNEIINKETEARLSTTPKQQTNSALSERIVNSQRNGHSIDLTSEDNHGGNKTNGNLQRLTVFNAMQNKSKQVSQKLDLLSAQYLPTCAVSNQISCPILTATVVKDGICLQWDIQFIDPKINPSKYEIMSFQKSEIAYNNFPWRTIGEVAALPLPMACTLTYVAKMNTYFFAVRAWIGDDLSSVWSNVIMVEIN